MKISANLIIKLVGLLWTLGMAVRDGKLTDEELDAIGVKLSDLVKSLEEVL